MAPAMSYLSLSLSLSRRYAEEKGVRATSVDHYDREENITQTWRVDIGVGTHPPTEGSTRPNLIIHLAASTSSS